MKPKNEVHPSSPMKKSTFKDNGKSDLKLQFKTKDINMAKDYTQQTKKFKEKLKKMQNAKNMGLKFAKLFNERDTDQKLSFSKKCYFNPDHFFKRSWDTVMAMYHIETYARIILYSTIWTPVRVSLFYSEVLTIQDFIGKLVDGFFILDFIFTFFTAYYDKDNLITSKKAIAKRYLKSNLILDFITAVPLNIMLPTSSDDHTALPFFNFLVNYPRFLQFIRLTKLLRFSRVISDRDTFVEIIIFRRVINRTTKKLIETAVVVLLLFHTLACLWYIIGIYNLSVHDNWVMRLGYLDKTKVEIYMACFHWTVQTIFTVGYGDFPARTKIEQLFSIFLQSIGQFIYAYIISSISIIFSSMKRNSKELDNTHIYIDNLVEKGKIKKSTYSKVKRQLNQEEQSIMEKVEKICQKLRTHSTRKFRLHVYRKIYAHIKSFKSCQDEFLLAIGSSLLTAVYYAQEHIYIPQDRVRSIYFVSEGEVKLYHPERENEEIMTVQKGECFGDVEFFMEFDFRMVHARPVKECTVFILDYTVAEDIFERFDDTENDNFMKEAKAKYKIIEERIKGLNTGNPRAEQKRATKLRLSVHSSEDDDDDILEDNAGGNIPSNCKSVGSMTDMITSEHIKRLINIEREYMIMKNIKNSKDFSGKNKNKSEFVRQYSGMSNQFDEFVE